MKKIILSSIVCISLASCSGNKQKEETKTVVDMNPQFDKYKEQFIENLWKIYPGWASSQGYHKYDSILIVPNEESRSKELAFAKSNLDSLKTYDLNSLSDNNKTDYYMIENQLKSIDWSINEQKSFEWNPSEYNVSGAFAEMLNGNYDSLDIRLRNFYLKMANIPAYYEAAKKNIKNPTLEHTQLAIEQNLGGISVFEKDFHEALNKVHFGEHEKQSMEATAKESVKAIKDFSDWLKKLDNKTPRSFRLGKELYAKKFEFDIHSGYTIDQIYEKAITHKKELHQNLYQLADKLWNKYIDNPLTWGQRGPLPKPKDSLQLIKMVIDKISEKHVKPEDFQTAIEEQMPVLIDFIKKKDLIYIDPSKPLVVRKEPDYMAGVAGASISAPGPYDKNGNTYYNVGSLSGWDKEKAESYLREYNHYILQILNIHEAIPGHYTQLVYSNQSPSLIKSLFGNNAMIEGWAVYTERMMLENGYGNNEDEMWLMYYKWNLRSTCNTILDYSVHTKNMSREEAMNLLMNEAFQQKTEAEGKWRRVSVTQVQLCCYFTGYTEIYDFREELKKQMGDKFDLKKFHEKFLNYGSAPVKYIKELMLAEMEKESIN
ncbi:MAG: hypothetical protein A3F72_03260 [Bacteroidetes bacterium RIFCSPLOWO2_12_FULL_35_15]|nr:MAG: hypothetical protein A3F72_03260 [Bacteroidetes bacterium RIFCSPLOWO2_12_FULL_35_15]